MKKSILLAVLFVSQVAFAQIDTTVIKRYELSRIESKIDSINNESLNRITVLSNKVVELYKSKTALSETNNNLQIEVSKANRSISLLRDSLAVYVQWIQSNTDLGEANASAIKDNQVKLQAEISQTNHAIVNGDSALGANINNRTLIGIIAFLLSVILTIISAILLNRRRKSDISTLKEQAEFLNVQIVEKLTTEAGEISKLTTEVLKQASSINNNNLTPDHSLIKALADRITVMGMTLYKMDNTIRGHKQLSKSIKQMKDNLLANGYELVDMLGKPYHEGMKVTANFVEDENLEDGMQIITGIIKPQINYNGVMIQAAQITVSQN